MAVTKIKPIKSTLSKALDYIENPDKTDGKMLVSSFGCSYETADIEFEYTLSQALQKGNNLAFHLIQSFEPGEVDYQKAHEIGKQLADAVTKGQHEYVLTTHIDKGHVHNHIIFCAVNFVDHRKYNSNKRSYYGIRNMSDKLCRENGLSVVVPGKGSKGKSYAEYQAEKTGTSWKGKLKIAVDALIPQVSSFEELLTRLQAAGYEIKPGKYVSCRAPGQERFTRLKTLGADYTEEAIRERIAGRRAKAAKAPREQRGVSLLIDIENSIKAAQSKGYEQWAKIHNLKQAAKTMNFLTEHKIEQYADLVSRTQEMSAESGQAADALKNAEKRLADMAVLIKNVSTYQKTKPVYDAYRKARNREKYRAGQEQAIILHEAAARSLKAAGIAKLPNLAALQSEYEALQAQKEALYIRRNGESNMIKDEEVAPYLSEAFFRYASGQKMRDIAKWLNEQGVEPPMRHKKRILGKSYDAESDQWTTDMLRCLFRNPTYTGAAANGSRQIIAENCHEPYITKEQFYAFPCNMREGENKISIRKSYKKPNPLAKHIVCTCGYALCWHKDKKTEEELFYCRHCRAHKENGKNLKVPAATIYKKVMDALELEHLEEEKLAAAIQQGAGRKVIEAVRAEKSVQMKSVLAELNMEQFRRVPLYESYMADEITKEQYCAELLDYEEAHLKLNEQLTAIMEDTLVWERALSLRNPWIQQMAQYKTPEELDRNFVKKYIEQVTVTLLDDGQVEISLTMKTDEWKQMLSRIEVEGTDSGTKE